MMHRNKNKEEPKKITINNHKMMMDGTGYDMLGPSKSKNIDNSSKGLREYIFHLRNDLN